MNLTDSQKADLAAWLDEGLSLSDIQKKITSEFSINMTYMDLRFLIDDLEMEIVDKKKQEDTEAETTEKEEGAAEVVDAEAEMLPGKVSVEVDAIKRPGAMASGQVTFSDGQSLGWQLDQFGRLGLVPNSDSPEGYQPPEADIMEFQEELQKKLQGPAM